MPTVSRRSICRASVPALPPTTGACWTSWIRPHFGNHTKVSDVSLQRHRRLHRKITKAGHPRRANTVVAVLSKMFSLAIKWQMRDSNPCNGIEKNSEVKRTRYMIGDELARLTKALAEHPEQADRRHHPACCC